LVSQATIISYARWIRSGWLDTHEQPDLAKERHARWMGLYGNLARYGDAWPSAITRSTKAAVYRSSQNKLHDVGAGMAALDDEGLFIPGAATNRCLRNREPATAPWAIRGSVTLTEDTGDTADPHGASHACKVEDLGLVTVDDFYQLCTGFSGDEAVAPAFWIKRISTSGVLKMVGGWSKGDWRIDLSALPDSWVRITRSSSYLTTVVEEFSANSGSQYMTFAAVSGTIDFYIYQPHLEAGIEAGPDIHTEGSPVTRNALNLNRDTWATRIAAAGECTIDLEVKLPNVDLSAHVYICDVSDGSASDRLALYVHSSGDRAAFIVVSGGVTQASGTDSALQDIADGEWHRLSLALAKGRMSMLVNGEETVDADCTFPVGLSEFAVGRSYVDSAHLNGRIRNLKVYPYARH
jgi:hypothetical protein